jgi:uncharacterized membrane protein HdeD (DUF308 family)
MTSIIWRYVKGIALILLGIYTFLNADAVTATLVRIVGLAILFMGIGGMITHYKWRHDALGKKGLRSSFSDTLLGLILLVIPGVDEVLGYVLAIILFYIAFTRIRLALSYRKLGYQAWTGFLVFGLISALLGLLFLAAPDLLTNSLTVIISIIMVMSGVGILYGRFSPST